MNKKDLAEEYAIKAQENAIYFKNGNFPNMPLYQGGDIKAAFNAGRESVVENIPDLKWEFNNKNGYADTNGILGYNYHLYLIKFPIPNCRELWGFAYGLETPEKYCYTKEGAMQAANEDYKKRIKQALGL